MYVWPHAVAKRALQPHVEPHAMIICNTCQRDGDLQLYLTQTHNAVEDKCVWLH